MGGYGVTDPTYQALSANDDSDDLSRSIAKVMSPTSAAALVGPPPDSPPPTQPGVSTQRTGTLAYAPKEAVAKNMDTAEGRQSYNTQQSPIGGLAQGVSNPPDGGAVRSISQAPASQVQPVSNGTTSGGLRTVIRDLNGNPAGSPLAALAASRPGFAGAQVAQSGNGSAASSQPAPNLYAQLRTQQANAVQPQVSPAPLMPAGMGNGSANNIQPVRPAQSGVQPVIPPGQVQPAVPRPAANGMSPAPLNLGPGTVMPKLNAQIQAFGNTARMQAQYPGPATLGPMPASTGGVSPAPVLPATASPIAPAGQQRLAQDQSRLEYLQNSGSGISQIQNPVEKVAATAGDMALRMFAPGLEPFVGGTEGHHQLLVNRQLGVVGGDQSQLQAAAQLDDTRSQMNERDAQGRRYDAQANYYNPEPLSAGQAQSMGHPEWEGLKLDARDAERLVGGAAHNQTTLQTHFGGQQRNLSAEDAAAIGTPSLEGASMSNDEYQRLLQGTQRNQQWDTNNQRTSGQSDINNRRNNSTRITTQGMRDDTSEDNSNRVHPGGGAPKPIPAGVRDRIESQKQTALNKAGASFDSGESSQDDYLDNWQQAQNDYEGRIEAQTGQPVQHLDIRSNVDGQGKWIGNRSQPTTAQPQAQPGRQPGFVTQKGNHVAVGDPVKVGGRTGKVTGFNARTGRAQVEWDSSK